MSHTRLSFAVPDASQFARSLGQALKSRHAAGSPPPGHVELLNLMARALGHRNLQSLQTVRAASPLPATPEQLARLPKPVLAAEDTPPALALSPHARKALEQFDSRGRLARWPHKLSVQRLAMWVLWARFDGRRVYAEHEVNEILRAAHTFGDHATLRRELVNHQLLARKSDCSEYRKLPARPDDEARAVLQGWRLQLRAHRTPRTERADSPRRLIAAAAQRGLRAG